MLERVVEEGEPSYTAGGSVSWCSHYRKQYEGSLTKRRITIWSNHPTPGHISRENYNSKRYMQDFPGGLLVKNPLCNAGDMGLIPGRGTKIPHATAETRRGQILKKKKKCIPVLTVALHTTAERGSNWMSINRAGKDVVRIHDEYRPTIKRAKWCHLQQHGCS